MNTFEFNGNQVSQIFKGNWQLAGGHGEVDKEQAISDLSAYADAGINVFDMGDAYTGVEALVGEFRRSYSQSRGTEAAANLRLHTKFIPDLDTLGDLSKNDVRAVITRSLGRLGLERLHLVQFHWWDYEQGDPVQTAQYLDELREEGLIETVGLTNFDTEHTKQILDAGVQIKSNQTQLSLIDTRPHNGMLELAREEDIKIFCYGSLAGGLLGGSHFDPDNRSHIKYALMVQETNTTAGPDHYRRITDTLGRMAGEYDTTPANIASRYVLQTPGVSSVILGPRNTKHLGELSDLDELQLSQNDYNELFNLAMEGNVPDEDIYSYERVPGGPHSTIMHMNGNEMRSNR